MTHCRQLVVAMTKFLVQSPEQNKQIKKPLKVLASYQQLIQLVFQFHKVLSISVRAEEMFVFLLPITGLSVTISGYH